MMDFLNEPIPLVPAEEVANRELIYKAFLSHEGTEKRTVVDLLRRELHRHGISNEKVFYDNYIRRGGNIKENQENCLMNGLLASEYLIAFLTPDFLKKKWPMWELRAFLEMMEKDERRKFLPVFYKVSARECGDIAKQKMSNILKEKLGLIGDSEKLRRLLEKVKDQMGVDAEGLHIPDSDVVITIMKDVFDVDVQYEGHDVATCSKPLCSYPICTRRIMSSVSNFFAVPPEPSYTKLKFENPERPEKMLKDKLLSMASNTVAAVGVKGMGGVGKTTCLIGVANDCQVREAFPEGILWIQLSKDTTVEKMRGILISILKYAWYRWKKRDLGAALNPQTPLDDVVRSTREALKEKMCLVVLDDVWPCNGYETIVSCFMEIVGPSSRILLSTRHSEVVKRFRADRINVGDLDDETASELFDDWCGGNPGSEEEQILKKEILRQCSNVALAVCIAGSNVKRIAECGTKRRGLERVLSKLKGNLASLKIPDHLSADRKLNAVMQTSIASIVDKSHQDGYRYLAVFRSKTLVPNQALEALWGIDSNDVEDRVDLYVECSLATKKIYTESESSSSFFVEFHDQHLAYAKYSWRCAHENLRAGKRARSSGDEEILANLHAQLLDGYGELYDDLNTRVWWEAEQLDDGYFYENYAHHLAKARKVGDLLKLLMDYRWIALRCRRQEMTGLLGDFDLAILALRASQKGTGFEQRFFNGLSAASSESIAAVDASVTCETVLSALRLVQAALRASQAVLLGHKDEVSFQLVGRLRAHSRGNVLIKRLIDSARQWEQRAWLCPVTQCFESPMSGAFQVLRPSSFAVSVAVVDQKRHLVAYGTFDGHVGLWDWSRGRSLWSRKLHKAEVSSLAATKNGSVLVSGSDDNTVRLWDVESGECKSELRGHKYGVRSVTVTKDGNVVVLGTGSNTVRLWDVESEEFVSVLRRREDDMSSTEAADNWCAVASRSEGNLLELWNMESGEHKNVLLGHKGEIRSVAVTEGGSVVAAGSDDSTVLLWNVKNGKCKRVFRGHQHEVSSVAVTGDGSVLVSGSYDKTVRLWNVESGDCNSVLQGHEDFVSSVAVTEDGRVVVSGSWDNTIRLWNLESGECRRVFRGHEDFVNSVAVTEDGSVVVSGSWDNTIRLWNVENEECKGALRGHTQWVSSVAVTGDRSVVVSGSLDTTIRLWSVEDGECKRVLRGHEGEVHSVAVTEDGSVVVSGSWDKTIRFWNAKSGNCKRVLRGHEGGVNSVAVTDDRSVVVSGSEDKTVRLWNVKREVCMSVLRGHEDSVSSVAVTEDGSIVVSGSRDKTVRLWNADSGECNGVLREHDLWVSLVAVTKDGSAVVSVSDDKKARLWNVGNRKCLKTVSFGDGASFFFKGGDGIGVSYLFNGRDLLRWARSIGLLKSSDAGDLSGPGSRFLPGKSEINAGAGMVRIGRSKEGAAVISATFDNMVESAIVVNLAGCLRVVVVGLHMFVLEIMNPNQLEKEISLLNEGVGRI